MDTTQLLADTAHLAGTPAHNRLSQLCTTTTTPWRRTTLDAHVTVGALVVDPVSRTMAGVLHPKFDRWMQIGGHIEDADNSVIASAVREAREEVGLVLDPRAGTIVDIGVFEDISCPSGRTSAHIDIRVFWIHPQTKLICSPESDEVAWLPLDGLPHPHDEDLAYLAALAKTLI
jgi:8-oxo-dGTP pyrophosphatase MutT (NUDIX family)